jgi:hypothetical protein
MSAFNRFCAKVRRTAIRVGDKIEEIGDNAAATVKMKGLQIRIDEQYEKLGEIVYRDLHTEQDLEEEKLAVVAAIDALFDELEAIKASKESTDGGEEPCDADEKGSDEEPATEAAPEEKTEEKVEENTEEA